MSTDYGHPIRAFFMNIPNISSDWADRLNNLEYIHDVSAVRVHEKARKQVSKCTYIHKNSIKNEK